VSPPWFGKRAYKCVSSTLPTTFARSHPRRADGRRSCECAFVHRKNRHSFRRTVVATAPGAGGVSPPWFRKRAYKCVSSTLPTMFARSHPRRADARRSCERAFLQRKRRYFHGERTPFTAPGAGGVSPPWFRYRDCTSVPGHSDGSLPRLCSSVPASAFP
jgi:hypothetical protein